MSRQVQTVSDDENRPGVAGGRGKRGALAIFAFTARSLQQVSTLVITLLAARFLLPAEYGVYSLGVVFVTLIQTMTYTGFYHHIITSKAEEGALLSTSFWMICGLASGAALLLMALAGPIAWAFAAPELQPVLLLLAAAQPFAGASAWFSAVLLRQQRMTAHFTIMFIQNLLALVLGALLLGVWQSLYALVAFRYVRVFSGLLLYLLGTRARPGLQFDRALARAATAFSGGLYGSRFLTFLSRYAGDLILGLTFSTAEAGLYRFGNRVATGAVDVIAQPMRSFALTQIAAAGRQGRSLSPAVDRFIGGTVLLTGGVAAVIAVFAEQIVTTLFNPAYLPAVIVTYAMAVRGVVSIGPMLLEPVLATRERTGQIMRFNLVWAVITVVSVVLSAPYGLAILAWTQVAVTAASTLWAVLLMQRMADVPVAGPLRALLVAGALVSIYGLGLAASWPVIADLVGVAGGGALAVGLIWALALSLPTLAAGRALRVFSLNIFSG